MKVPSVALEAIIRRIIIPQENLVVFKCVQGPCGWHSDFRFLHQPNSGRALGEDLERSAECRKERVQQFPKNKKQPKLTAIEKAHQLNACIYFKTLPWGYM